jgi:hypothetical protein
MCVDINLKVKFHIHSSDLCLINGLYRLFYIGFVIFRDFEENRNRDTKWIEAFGILDFARPPEF